MPKPSGMFYSVEVGIYTVIASNGLNNSCYPADTLTNYTITIIGN